MNCWPRPGNHQVTFQKTALFGKVRWHNYNGPFWPCNLQTLIICNQDTNYLLSELRKEVFCITYLLKTSAISQRAMYNVQDFHRLLNSWVQQPSPVGQIQPGLPCHTASDTDRCSIWGGNAICVDYDMNKVDSSFYPGLSMVEETQNLTNAFLQNQSPHFSN